MDSSVTVENGFYGGSGIRVGMSDVASVPIATLPQTGPTRCFTMAVGFRIRHPRTRVVAMSDSVPRFVGNRESPHSTVTLEKNSAFHSYAGLGMPVMGFPGTPMQFWGRFGPKNGFSILHLQWN